MEIPFKYKDNYGIEMMLEVYCKVILGEVQVFEVAVNGQTVPRQFIDNFVEMIGFDNIEREALESEAS